MKKKYEKPFIMKVDINNTKVLATSSGLCEIDEINTYRGNQKGNDVCIVTIGYADDGEWWFL